MHKTGLRFNHDKFHGAEQANADLLNAKANLMEQQRLATKAQQLHKIGEEASHIESGRTQDALGKLGAGKSYGSSE